MANFGTVLFTFIFMIPVLASTTDSDFLVGRHQLEEMQRISKETVLIESRNMQLKIYPQKTSCVAVVIHGLFQSPKDMQGLIDYFYNQGCNVVAPLLAAHWHKDDEIFYKINYKTWLNQISEVLSASEKLGKKIILVGHSAGSLLALDQIINNVNKYNISHAILFAPAIKLKTFVILSTKIGSIFKWNENFMSVISKNVDHEYDQQIRPAIAGVHVQNLIESIFGQSLNSRSAAYMNIHVPILIVSTENDATVDHVEILKLKNYRPQFIKLISYPKESLIQHDNIQRSIIDVPPGSPNSWFNSKYKELLEQITNFLNH